MIKLKHFWRQRWGRWCTIVTIILLIIGGYSWYRHWQESQVINRPITAKVTTQTTTDTLKQGKIKPFTKQDLLKYRQMAFDRHVDQYPNGYLTIKRPGIQLPIYNRANNLTLALGVGKSYFLDSQMGVGNFVLAGHNMLMPGVLLSNLYLTRIGDRMSISNRQYTYQYRVTVKHTINADVTLINGAAQQGSALYLPRGNEKPLLTVYTCADGGYDRLMVQGVLVAKQRK